MSLLHRQADPPKQPSTTDIYDNPEERRRAEAEWAAWTRRQQAERELAAVDAELCAVDANLGTWAVMIEMFRSKAADAERAGRLNIAQSFTDQAVDLERRRDRTIGRRACIEDERSRRRSELRSL